VAARRGKGAGCLDPSARYQNADWSVEAADTDEFSISKEGSRKTPKKKSEKYEGYPRKKGRAN